MVQNRPAVERGLQFMESFVPCRCPAAINAERIPIYQTAAAVQEGKPHSLPPAPVALVYKAYSASHVIRGFQRGARPKKRAAFSEPLFGGLLVSFGPFQKKLAPAGAKLPQIQLKNAELCDTVSIGAACETVGGGVPCLNRGQLLLSPVCSGFFLERGAALWLHIRI